MEKIVINNWSDVEKQISLMAKKRAIVAREEAKLNKVIAEQKEKYENNTEENRREIEEISEALFVFCSARQSEFQEKRERSFSNGTIGFRNHPSKVMQLNKKYKAETSLELIKRILDKKYIRTKEEIDKESILVDYRTPIQDEKAEEKAVKKMILDDASLASVGLRVDKEESFFIDTKWDELVEQNRTTVKVLAI